MNVSSYDVNLSDLRFNFHYVLIYNIAIRQLVTGKTFTQSIILHRPMIILSCKMILEYLQGFSFFSNNTVRHYCFDERPDLCYHTSKTAAITKIAQ